MLELNRHASMPCPLNPSRLPSMIQVDQGETPGLRQPSVKGHPSLSLFCKHMTTGPLASGRLLTCSAASAHSQMNWRWAIHSRKTG